MGVPAAGLPLLLALLLRPMLLHKTALPPSKLTSPTCPSARLPAAIMCSQCFASLAGCWYQCGAAEAALAGRASSKLEV